MGAFARFPSLCFFTGFIRPSPQAPIRHDWIGWPGSSHLWAPAFRCLSSDFFAGHISGVRRSPLAWHEKVRCYWSLVGWFWYFRDWLVEDFRALLHGRLAPWLKRHAPWTRPLWHAIKPLKDRLRRPELATAKARRARRAQSEQWELKAERRRTPVPRPCTNDRRPPDPRTTNRQTRSAFCSIRQTTAIGVLDLLKAIDYEKRDEGRADVRYA